MRIPFDSVVLSSVLEEIEPYIGAQVQGIRQPDRDTVTFQLYRGPVGEAVLLMSCNAEFARVHFVTRRPRNPSELPAFCAALRARLDGATLVRAEQVAMDRVLVLRFSSERGEHELVAELMGKHSNLILVEAGRRIVSAAKWVRPDKSKRPILPGRRYEWPPVLRDQGNEGTREQGPKTWAEYGRTYPERVSPFYRMWLECGSAVPEDWTPNLVPGNGAYPLDLAALGLQAVHRSSMSLALEQHFAQAETTHRLESLRASLLSQFERVNLARETAIADLQQTLATGAKAGQWQLFGELILAYGAGLEAGAKSLRAWDYEGSPVEIKLDPELDFKRNSADYFDRAKRAKGRVGLVEDQIKRLEADREILLGHIERVRAAPGIDELTELLEGARLRRWLTDGWAGEKDRERPYEGHRIRELMGPGGVRVLYGENAESNDYLTLRVAKPDDMWLHIRGSTSAHVVILSEGHPERINREHLLFAAKIAVAHSPSKHAGYVPVDYTLRRYVRRQRGAPKGTALYTHEKTLHVEGG